MSRIVSEIGDLPSSSSELQGVAASLLVNNENRQYECALVLTCPVVDDVVH